MSDAHTNLPLVPPVQTVAILDTTELRWFSEGRLPPGVTAWFTNDGEAGAHEERCDIYRLNRRRDIGVKLRARRTLELKIRQSVGEPLSVRTGLTGQVEAWRKWSPADSLVDRNDDLAWVDVHKRVIKRRFWVDGDECRSSEEAALLTAGGVDVEVAAVTVEGVEAWTFAFAAFGPPASRRDAIVSASQTLFAGEEPQELGFLSSRSGGYPDWIMHVASPRRSSQNPSRPQVLPAADRVVPAGGDASNRTDLPTPSSGGSMIAVDLDEHEASDHGVYIFAYVSA